MIVVDTNVLVDVLRGVPEAVAAVADTEGGLFIPSVVRFEILAGARETEMPRVTALLDACHAVPIDSVVADVAGELSRRYRRSDGGIDAIDYLVAATAVLLQTSVMTLNVKHFPMFVGLRPAY
jgi:predicted nucleic acid-binding protein